MTKQIIHVIEPRGVGVAARARELWQHRHLFRYFSIITIRRTYRATVLGWLWLFIRPLVPAIISTLVLNQVAGIQLSSVPYVLFVLAGLSVWSLFDEGAIWATRSLQIHRGLLTQIYFPRLILPISALVPGIVTLMIHLSVLTAVVIYFLSVDGRFYLNMTASIALIIPAVIMGIGAALGIGLFTSVLGAEKRDIRFILRYILRIWFFVTPIVYPLSLVPNQWRPLMAYNPLTTVVELFRWGLLGIPSDLTGDQIVISVLTVLALGAAGLWFFTRAEATMIDHL